MPLNTDQDARLKDWVEKNHKTDSPAEEVPQEDVSNSVASTEESDKPVAQETPKEQPDQEEKQPEVEETPALEWDADETEEKTPEQPKLDFSQLASGLELGEVKDETEFKAKVSELKSKLKEYEEKPLAGIPEDFKEVIEVAKLSGADWKSYLAESLIDYSKFDSDGLIQLYEEQFFRDAVRNPRYQTDGKFDQAKAEAALETVPEIMREEWGRDIAGKLTQNQRAKQNEIRQKAQARLDAAERSLNQATKNLAEILPVENYGIKFEPKHSTEIYTGIVNSKLTKKHLGLTYEQLVQSGADMKAVVRTITLGEKGEKMISFKSKNSEAKAKADILKNTQNAQIKGQSTSPTPDAPENKESPLDKLKKTVQAQRQVGL